MARVEVKCPAAEERHPIFSPNPLDVECRFQGNLRPARSQPDATGQRKTVVCCAAYAECPIWKEAVYVERFGPSQKRQRDTLLAPDRARDVGRGLSRS